MSALETQAKIAWQTWGSAWGMFTQCASCKRFVYCRGPRKKKLICLACFDVSKR